MNVVPRIVDSVLSPSRGVAFFGVCLSVAGGLYFAGITDGQPNPASANAMSGPPVVKAELIDLPTSGVARLSGSPMRPLVSTVIPSDRPTLVRRLQAALAHAGCYEGPISGAWSDTSKEAMARFIAIANARLPVNDPDPALLSLVETNEAVSCGGRGVTTGSIDRQGPVPILVAEGPQVEDRDMAPKTVASKESDAPAAEPGTLERAWAPAAMLTMTKEAPTPAATPVASKPTTDTQNIIVGSSTPDREEDVAPPPAVASPPPPVVAAARPVAPPTPPPTVTAVATPEPLPVSQQKIEVQPDPTAVPDPRDEPRDTPHEKSKKERRAEKQEKAEKSEKAKSAKKRIGKGDQPGSFSDGLYSLQRSVSNLFSN